MEGNATAPRLLVMLAATVGCIATFLPWAGVGPVMVGDGTAGDGWITLVCFAGVFAISTRPTATGAVLGTMLLAGVAAAIAVVDLSRLQSVNGLTAGPGLELAAISSLAIVLIAALATRWWLGPCVLLAATGLVLAGNYHVVRARDGLHVCSKSRWTLSATFIELADYRSPARDDSAADDLIACELLQIER